MEHDELWQSMTINKDMRILEIGPCRYVSAYFPDACDFYVVSKKESKEKPLNFYNLFVLRRRLKKGYYDLVIYHIIAKVSAPWHRYGFGPGILLDILIKTLFQFRKIGWHYLHWFVCGSSVPLVIIDTQDVPRITKSESVWLDRCCAWFMRELPPNYMNLFLNMDRRCGDVVNIQRNQKIKKNLAKIKPFSLGLTADDADFSDTSALPEKIYDVFYSGANHTTTVRQKGLEELKALKKEGLRIFIPENRLPRKEFLKACSQAWLIWSPEGQGWDCHRHYESLMVGSVPVINYPTIEVLWPLENGKHCIYYHPGPGGLTSAIKKALEDTDSLLKIAREGRDHVIKYHDRKKLAQHVLDSVALHTDRNAAKIGCLSHSK